jgi:hypothetical protein
MENLVWLANKKRREELSGTLSHVLGFLQARELSRACVDPGTAI